MKTSLSRRTILLGATAGSLLMPLRGLRAADVPRVAAIHASPVENAWNSVLHRTLTEAAAAGQIDYSYSEGVSATDYPRAMREYAEKGNQLIVGEAFAIERQARSVAQDYPDTAFLFGSSGGPQPPNFGTFSARTTDAAYLAGMLAGAMTKTGAIGTVAAIPIPEVNMVVNAFTAGALAVNPAVTSRVTFIGTFFDPPKAREAGLALIDAGADILYGERIGTADAAKERGVLAIGALIDYSPRYPGTVFANVMMGFRSILDAALVDLAAGRSTGRDYTAQSALKAGGSDIQYVADEIPPAALAAMLARREEIKAGTFTVALDMSEPK